MGRLVPVRSGQDHETGGGAHDHVARSDAALDKGLAHIENALADLGPAFAIAFTQRVEIDELDPRGFQRIAALHRGAVGREGGQQIHPSTRHPFPLLAGAVIRAGTGSLCNVTG